MHAVTHSFHEAYMERTENKRLRPASPIAPFLKWEIYPEKQKTQATVARVFLYFHYSGLAIILGHSATEASFWLLGVNRASSGESADWLPDLHR